MQRRVERRECLQRRLDVGRLGVVHVAHAVELADLLEPVRQGREVRAAQQRRPPRRRPARVRRRSRRPYWPGCAGPRRCEAAKASSNALELASPRRAPCGRGRAGRRRPAQRRRRRRRTAWRCRVGALALEDAQLGGRVGLERAMPVEVIGRDVEKDAGIGAESLDALELEARELARRSPGPARCGRPASRAPCRRCPRSRTARLRPRACGRQQRGRGLAVRSGDADDRIALLEQAIGELHLGPHGDAGRACGLDDRGFFRDAGALDEQIGTREQLGIVAAGHRFDAWRRLPCIRAAIGEQDVQVRGTAPERLRRRDAGADRPEHDDAARAGEHGIHQVYWSNRRYASTNADPASSAAMIQKRTMIFVSDQAFISKWWWIGAIRKTRRP